MFWGLLGAAETSYKHDIVIVIDILLYKLE